MLFQIMLTLTGGASSSSDFQRTSNGDSSSAPARSSTFHRSSTNRRSCSNTSRASATSISALAAASPPECNSPDPSSPQARTSGGSLQRSSATAGAVSPSLPSPSPPSVKLAVSARVASALARSSAIATSRSRSLPSIAASRDSSARSWSTRTRASWHASPRSRDDVDSPERRRATTSNSLSLDPRSIRGGRKLRVASSARGGCCCPVVN
mmetsp:Transcript_7644/g.33712  ORF Transcript_7644/g.33712 Transcript_7644/m.33712 type:complete len:210 (+) Transcript_7644:525-1154(+)